MTASIHPIREETPGRKASAQVALHEDEFLRAEDLVPVKQQAAEREMQRTLRELAELTREKKWADAISLFYPVEEKLGELAALGVDTRVTEKERSLFARPDFRQRLPADDRLELARLAQMAGEIEPALEILEALNRESPQLLSAWLQRVEILGVMNRGAEAAGLLARAREALDPEALRELVQSLGPQDDRRDDQGVQAAIEPFARLHQRQQALAHYMALFQGREDVFARQWADRSKGRQGYVPVRRPMEPEDV